MLHKVSSQFFTGHIGPILQQAPSVRVSAAGAKNAAGTKNAAIAKTSASVKNPPGAKRGAGSHISKDRISGNATNSQDCLLRSLSDENNMCLKR
jgi:hypothetical protein